VLIARQRAWSPRWMRWLAQVAASSAADWLRTKAGLIHQALASLQDRGRAARTSERRRSEAERASAADQTAGAELADLSRGLTGEFLRMPAVVMIVGNGMMVGGADDWPAPCLRGSHRDGAARGRRRRAGVLEGLTGSVPPTPESSGARSMSVPMFLPPCRSRRTQVPKPRLPRSTTPRTATTP
jgi:hypothetical protein